MKTKIIIAIELVVLIIVVSYTVILMVERHNFKPFYPTPTGEPITEIRSVNLLTPEVANQVIRGDFK